MSVADLGKGPGGPRGRPLILGKNKSQKEEKPAGKPMQTPTPRVKSRSRSAIVCIHFFPLFGGNVNDTWILVVEPNFNAQKGGQNEKDLTEKLFNKILKSYGI